MHPTHIGNNTRYKILFLPPRLTHQTARAPDPRQAFMEMMRTVSGFRVRMWMWTLFVPYTMTPGGDRGGEGENNENDDALEAGLDQHTVGLSVEIDNMADPGESSFLVETIDVKIGDVSVADS